MAEFFSSSTTAYFIEWAILVFLVGTPVTLFLIACAIIEKAKAISEIATTLKKLANSITQS